MTMGHYRLVDGRVLEGVMVQTLLLSTLGKDRLNWGTYASMPHTTASWVQTKAEVALASHWICEWHIYEGHSIGTTFFKVLVPSWPPGLQNSTLPEISPSVFIKLPTSSPFLLVNTPHWEGAASPIKTFHFQVSLSSILQMTHPLALMLLKSARFCNHF